MLRFEAIGKALSNFRENFCHTKTKENMQKDLPLVHVVVF